LLAIFPILGADSGEFIVEMHHGGFFTRTGVNRAYVGGQVHCFDHCEAGSWSPVWFNELLFMLHYLKNPNLKMYWLLPGKDISDGIRLIFSDSDTLVMASLVGRVRTFVLYADHDDSLAGLDWDDIVANPIRSLPKVISHVEWECRIGT